MKTHLLTFLQGLAIGAANAIPGVSGGTLALVFGIYERLIESLKALAQRPFWSDLLKLNLAGAFKTINGTFLVVLVAGAMLSLLTLAQGLEWLFSHYPTLILSFFFGLILASILPVSRHIDRWQAHTITAFVLGILFGFVLVGLTPSQLPTTRPFLFLSGALAASAMIVPGISGAFVLVLLGNYDAILSILNDRNFSLILVIGLGAIVGLLSLAQLLSWLFKRYQNTTLAILMGFMLGTLRKIWPWKTGGFESTEIPQNSLPRFFLDGSVNLETLASLGLISGAIVLVLVLDQIGKKQSTPAKSGLSE